MTTPPQPRVLLHNPMALRADLHVSDGLLQLWWSPLAGKSSDYSDRNYSNRDDHLEVFERIRISGIDPVDFEGCDYDACRARLMYAGGAELTLDIVMDRPAVVLSANREILVECKSARHDGELARGDGYWVLDHEEGGRTFHFALATRADIRHAPVHSPGNARYGWIRLQPGETLVIGVGLAGDECGEMTRDLAAMSLEEICSANEALLAAALRQGTPEFVADHFDQIYQKTRRSLYGQIDASGAVRASLKDIYYLIWLRDGAFCSNYQAAAGWPHRHAEWCRLVLANPLTIDEPNMPPGKMFGQLVNRTYGKLEEDGLYYVVWSVFSHAVRTGSSLLDDTDRKLLAEALEWLEAYSWDAERGLFFSRFADETPVRKSRDHGIDAAIGARSAEPGLALDGRLVERSYDHYFNLLMHGVYAMLAALPGQDATDAASCRGKADALWRKLAPGLDCEGLPPYGELLMEDGGWVTAPPYRPLRSVYVWAYCLPGLAPIPRIDAIRLALLRDVMASPRLHWINGIAALIAAVDPLACDEREMIAALEQLAAQAERPGLHLPMGGTMPEKFDAPDGSLHDDIRPQAFAQSAFLAACASLGVRCLPFGIAVRPTSFIRAWRAYPWRGAEIDFVFDDSAEGVRIDGEPLPHSLQVPDDSLPEGRVCVTVGRMPQGGALVRSNVALKRIERNPDGKVIYQIESHGAAELVFDIRPAELELEGSPKLDWSQESGLSFVRFTSVGHVSVAVRF